ncbi:MAG TPA: hypothetical protein VKA70_07730 [Blastocatellia bacterium]|nr:hypothetical protein [Blastocatellia bacterium]
MIRKLVVSLICSALFLNVFAQATTERKAVELLGYASEIAAAAGDEIWPGFDARRYSFVMTGADADEYTIGFGGQSKEPARKAMMSFDMRRYDLEDAVSLIFHEAFHVFERDAARSGAKWRAENSMLVSEYPETSARNSALFNVESQILHSALLSADKAEAKRKAREFIAVRRMRQGELEVRFVEFEKGLESNEGLAEYAGVKAVSAAIEAASQKRAAMPFKKIDKSGYLADRFERLRRITRVGRNSRLRFYDTGAAQALLLDRLMPGWKARVQATAVAVQDLVEEAAGDASPASKQIAESALRQYGYEDVLKSEREVADRKMAERRALLDSVLNSQGRRYVIDVSALGRMGDLVSFDPMNVTMIDNQTRVHTRMLSVGREGSFKATFEQPVVEDIAGRKYVTISKADQNEIVVDGAPLDAASPIEKEFQTIRITTPGFKFEASSGVVVVNGQTVTVRVGKN